MPTPVTYPTKFYRFVNEHWPFKVAKGGRGSAKSHSFGKLAITTAFRKRTRIACVRELQNSIKESVHKLLCDKIEELGLSPFFHITDKSIKSWNGSEFIFMGLRSNYNEIKSLEGVDICWLEEADGCSQQSLDILIPTIRKDNSELWVSFNPEIEGSACDNEFVRKNRPDALVIEMNWRDNPWFPEKLKNEMEYCKETDFEKYMWIWEGQYKKYGESVIFKNKIRVEEFESANDDEQYHVGMDFGYSVDPTAINQMFIRDRTLYIDYEFYGYHVEIEQLPDALRTLPAVNRNFKVTADNARPETISYLANKGFNIEGCEKGKGSVEDGIEFLKSFEAIVIHPRCTGTIKDFSNYRWKTDRVTGMILPIPLDSSNHSPDACRYALEPWMKATATIYDVMR